MTDQNPLRPDAPATSEHLLDIVSLAMSEWVSRQKLPLVEDSLRGPIKIGAEEIILMQAITRSLIIDNKETIDRKLRKE